MAAIRENLVTEERTILVRGGTFPYRQEIKELGGVWIPHHSAWRLPYSARFQVADLLRGAVSCRIEEEPRTPALPQSSRPRKPFVRLRLVSMPIVLNGRSDLAIVDGWYDVEMDAGAFPLCRCYVVKGGVTQKLYFTCSERSLERHFESQI